jgi:hypothetical protein
VSIFNKFKEFLVGREDKKIESALEKIKDPKAIRDDRMAAIQYLCSLESWEQAVPALLQRFEYSLEHGINDTREKEASLKGIVAYGQGALPAVKEHLKNSLRIAWPIKIIKELGDESHLTEILFDCLDFTDVSLDQAKVDKNYDILCYLRDCKLPQGKMVEICHFLKDHDERVRFASAEVLIEQNDPIIASFLEPFLGDESPDNTRIRQSSLQAFIEKGWKVEKIERFPQNHIVGPIYLRQDGSVYVRA